MLWYQLMSRPLDFLSEAIRYQCALVEQIRYELKFQSPKPSSLDAVTSVAAGGQRNEGKNSATEEGEGRGDQISSERETKRKVEEGAVEHKDFTIRWGPARAKDLVFFQVVPRRLDLLFKAGRLL